MNVKTVYVSLSQFCEHDLRPRQVLLDAGYRVIENKTGRRIKEEEMYEALKGVDAVLAAVEPYSAALLSKLGQLKCISRCGAGTDAIDLEAAEKYRIEILATKDEIVEPVAQATVAMILALAKNYPLHFHDFREGLWKKRTSFLLSEWTVGLVGFGKIGRKVAEYLLPFGSKILVFDPLLRQKELAPGVIWCDMDTLLASSDLVSLHAARLQKEGYLFSKREFSIMKKGSFFVNTARGYMVDESALKEALEGKHLAGAALDVFEEEPYRGPLAKCPNVLLTPHVSTLTWASRIAMEIKCAQNVVDYFSNFKE